MTELVNKRSEVALAREAARRTLKQRTMTEPIAMKTCRPS